MGIEMGIEIGIEIKIEMGIEIFPRALAGRSKFSRWRKK